MTLANDREARRAVAEQPQRDDRLADPGLDEDRGGEQEHAEPPTIQAVVSESQSNL